MAGTVTGSIGARARPRDLRVVEEMIPATTRTALADPVTRNSPRMPTVEELTDLITPAQ